MDNPIQPPDKDCDAIFGQTGQLSKGGMYLKLIKRHALEYDLTKTHEKRKFAKKKVMDHVIQVGGLFLHKETGADSCWKELHPVEDKDAILLKIQQAFRSEFHRTKQNATDEHRKMIAELWEKKKNASKAVASTGKPGPLSNNTGKRTLEISQRDQRHPEKKRKNDEPLQCAPQAAAAAVPPRHSTGVVDNPETVTLAGAAQGPAAPPQVAATVLERDLCGNFHVTFAAPPREPEGSLLGRDSSRNFTSIDNPGMAHVTVAGDRDVPLSGAPRAAAAPLRNAEGALAGRDPPANDAGVDQSQVVVVAAPPRPLGESEGSILGMNNPGMVDVAIAGTPHVVAAPINIGNLLGMGGAVFHSIGRFFLFLGSWLQSNNNH